MDHEKLSRIPVVPWVLLSIEKASKRGDSSMNYWHQAWEETYYELGGESASVARKGCPMKAAHGLWRSGRIVGHSISNPERVSLKDMRKRFGKNAAYAHIALGLLQQGRKFDSAASLWVAVQEEFRSQLNEEPAASEQGGVRIAKILHEAGVAR